MKKTLVLVNVGTPKQPSVKEVRRFLTEFLNDKRVIDIPWMLRKILVNLIIIPFRAKKSARLYQRLWTAEGSPILLHLKGIAGKVQRKLEYSHQVYACMRYGEPSLAKVLNKIEIENTSEIVVLPLYPQYASSTTGSVADKVFDSFKTRQAIPSIYLIEQFYSHPAFIKAYTNCIAAYNPALFDHIIFSYHGLPLRQIRKIHPGIDCKQCTCEQSKPECGTWCYKATCYETTRLLAKELNLPEGMYSVAFQSRLTRNWLSPFTDEAVVERAQKGQHNILIAAPSFVADCLETLVEIEIDYQHLFKQHGGTNLTLVKSLNDSDEWADAITEIIKQV